MINANNRTQMLILALALLALGVVSALHYFTKVQEQAYNEGIRLIELGKWEEAWAELDGLNKKGYADSSVLFNYAFAKDLYLEKDYITAHSYLDEIPDNYDGLFKKDILKFKQEVAGLTKNTQLPTTYDTAPATGYIVYSGTGTVLVALDEGTMDELVDAAVSHDYAHYDKVADQCLPVKDGTSIDIVGTGLARTKIRITEGSFSGHVGYIQTEFIKIR